MTTTRTALGLSGFILTVVLATWLVGPLALIVAWLIVVVVLAAAAVAAPTHRMRWVIAAVAVLVVGLPVMAVVEMAAGPVELRLFG